MMRISMPFVSSAVAGVLPPFLADRFERARSFVRSARGAEPNGPAPKVDLEAKAASGRFGRHSTYELLLCPAPKRGVYVLSKRTANGRSRPVFVGLAASEAPSLNLARIRQRGATLEAREVHLFELPDTTAPLRLRRIVRELRTSLITQH